MKVYVVTEFIHGSYEGLFEIDKVFADEQSAIDYCGDFRRHDYHEREVEHKERA